MKRRREGAEGKEAKEWANLQFVSVLLSGKLNQIAQDFYLLTSVRGSLRLAERYGSIWKIMLKKETHSLRQCLYQSHIYCSVHRQA